MVKNFEEPALTLSKDGLRIASADVSAALEKKKLSASLITGLEGCHARWLFDTFVSRDLVAEEPDNAARRGSLFHKVMEDFFALPPNERTKDRLNAVVNTVLQGEEFKDMLGYPEAMQWLKQAIRNYYDMGAKPERVKVARIPEVTRDGRPYEKNGLEIFVKGNIGGTKRDILGFIDRLVVDQRRMDEALIIEDWKGLALDTPIPTMDGWTTMGEVKVGDKILGTQGKEVTVLEKSKIHHRPCYRITFFDGSSVVADNEHLWEVRISDGVKVLSTDELYSHWGNAEHNSIRIDNPAPLKFPHATLSPTPYEFGAAIDGAESSMGNDATISMAYLRSSIEQRVKLLRGFMDNMGEWQEQSHRVILSTPSKELCNTLGELLAGLGITPFISMGNTGRYEIEFIPSGFNPFSPGSVAKAVDAFLESNDFSQCREVSNIEIINSVPTQCVKVDAENSLYLCGPLLTPTHNTGAKVKRWKAHTKSTDGLGETRQQVIYSMLLEQRDLTVSGARLIYPVAQEIVDVNLRDEEFKDRVVEDVKHADAALDVLQESNEFAFTPGFLCAWCSLAKICPASTIKPYKKMEDAYAQQPSPDILKQAIEVL